MTEESQADAAAGYLAEGAFIEAVFRDMAEAVIFTDVDRRIVRINPAAERLFGYAEAELIGYRTAVLYAEETDYAYHGQLRFNPVASCPKSNYRVRYKRRNGEVFTSETFGTHVRDRGGALIGYIGIIRDISDQVRVERCLHELDQISTDQTLDEAAKIRAILALGARHFGLPLGIVSRVEGDRYVVEHMAPADVGVAMGTPLALGDSCCGRVLAAGVPLGLHAGLDPAMPGHPAYPARAGPQRYLGMPLTVDGETYGTLNFSGPGPAEKPFDPADLEFLRLFAQWIANQLSARRRFVELRQARAHAEAMQSEAEAASRAKSAFIANMSHELRTPLNAVIGFTELVQQEPFGPIGHERYREYLENVHGSACHLLDLIHDLLDVCKLEAGRTNLFPEKLDLAAEVDWALQLLAGKIAEARLRVDREPEGAVLPVHIDRRACRQVLLNLLSNAVKYTEPGGRIRVTDKRVARDDRDPSSGTSDAPTAVCAVVIADTGVGVAPEEIDRLFHPFERGAAAQRSATPGTGLGLSLSRQLVETEGGWIAMDSQPGVGTTVTVAWPANPG